MKVLLSLLFFLSASFYGSCEESDARLLASKIVLNQFLVEGKDLTIVYNIYNIGESPAIDVQLSDDSFPETDFVRVQGDLDVKWDRISSGSNVSHAVVLQPLKSGYFNFTAATVTYKANENAKESLVGYTSAPGEGGIFNRKDYDRQFSTSGLDWMVFAIMTLPSLCIPFVLWYNSKTKYEIIKEKKN